MLKRTIRLAAIVAVVGLMLSGCYGLIDDGVGAVGIEIPDANQGGDPSDLSVARIYLINDNALVDISDSDAPEGVFYKHVVMESVENEVSVGPVPSGPGYQIVLALGDPVTAGESEVFVPERYAWTEEPFAVVAGEATPVELTSIDSPFSYATSVFGEDLVGLELINGSFYTASGDEGASAVFRLNPTTLLTGDSLLRKIDLPTDQTANSIGMGARVDQPTAVVPWINTSVGVIPYDEGADPSLDALNLAFFSDYPAGATKPAVLSSGAFVVDKMGAPGYYDLFGWFQVDGGIGGVYDEDDALVPGAKQWLTDIDLSTFLSGEPITDLVVTTSAGGEVEAYFASKLGAFMLPEAVLSDPEINEVPEILDVAEFFEVIVDGETAVITKLALVGTKFYLGTSRGVVSIPVASIGLPTITSSDPVTESLGRVVRDMAIGLNYHAILTDNLLIASANGGTSYSVVPIYAGIVTVPTGLFLDDSTGVVIISGETGLGAVDIDNL